MTDQEYRLFKKEREAKRKAEAEERQRRRLEKKLERMPEGERKMELLKAEKKMKQRARGEEEMTGERRDGKAQNKRLKATEREQLKKALERSQGRSQNALTAELIKIEALGDEAFADGYRLPYIKDRNMYWAVRGACSYIKRTGYFNKATSYYAQKYGVDIEILRAYCKVAAINGSRAKAREKGEGDKF